MSSVRTVCAVLLAGLVMGCAQEAPPPQYVARVGDQYLTADDISARLNGLQRGFDTAEARTQIVERWVTNALLYQEAERQGLLDNPDVQQRLREQERSVLINELTTQLLASVEPNITEADVRAYYQQHREQLRLRESYVSVRHLSTRSLDAAQSVQSELRSRTDSAAATRAWQALASSYALDVARAKTMAAQYHPERNLFRSEPILRQQLERLRPGETAPILEIGDRYHVMHLVDRAAPGTIPQPAWVDKEIRRRLALRARKQMYAREVERLRNEALARRDVDIAP
jgi:hypothetical protein